MSKLFLAEVLTIVLYSIVFYILLIPLSIYCNFWIPNISIALVLGLIFNSINNILFYLKFK